MKRASKLISLLVAGILLLSTIGCNGNTGPVNVMPTSTSVPTETPTPTAVPTETPTPTMPPDDGQQIYDADNLNWPQSCCYADLRPATPDELARLTPAQHEAAVAVGGMVPENLWFPSQTQYLQSSTIFSIPGQGTFEQVSLQSLPENFAEVLASGADAIECQNFNVVFWHKISDKEQADTTPKTTIYLVTREPAGQYSATVAYTSADGATDDKGSAYYKQLEADLNKRVGLIPNVANCEESLRTLTANGKDYGLICRGDGSILVSYDPVLGSLDPTPHSGNNPPDVNFTPVPSGPSSFVPQGAAEFASLAPQTSGASAARRNIEAGHL